MDSGVASGEGPLGQSNEALDDGGRILRAVVRPYPAKTAGIPIRWTYEFLNGQTIFEWEAPNKEDCRCRETEIFFPSRLLSGNRTLEVQGLTVDEWKYDRERQTIFILPITTPAKEGKYCIVICLSRPLEPLFTMTTHWQDFAGWYAVLLVLILGLVFVVKE